MRMRTIIGQIADCLAFFLISGLLLASLRYAPAIEAAIIELRRGL
jgi:hypothetical protein